MGRVGRLHETNPERPLLGEHSDSGSAETIGISRPFSRSSREVVGSSVSRYVVLEEIGQGAMGRVLRAYDPKLQREVALKQMHGEALGEETTRRLVTEARAMAKLSHRNVVSIFDVEELTEAGDVVLVMEYVPGTTLRRWLRDDKRSWKEIVGRFIEAGRGLAAAHERGVLHRDFKPANVLVSDRVTKVTDFGLAKGMGVAGSSEGTSSQEARSSERTGESCVVGTPRYMAPEQHEGADREGRGPLTAAVDQYAFCVALWEALTGSPPFSGEDLAAQKRRGPPAWKHPDVPRPVAQAIVKGLSVEADLRWPSLDALLDALTHDPTRRRKRRVAAVAVLGIVGVGGAMGVSWAQAHDRRCAGADEHLAGVWDGQRGHVVQGAIVGIDAPYAQEVWKRTAEQLDTYAVDWTAMHTEACEATAVRGEQSEVVLDLRMACLHRARMELDAVVGVLATADDGVVQRAHEVVASLPALSRCADIESLQADADPPESSEEEAVKAGRALLAEAKAEIRAGRFVEAQARVEAATDVLRDVTYVPVQGELAFTKGDALARLARYDEAVAALERSVELASRSRQRRLLGDSIRKLLYVVGNQQQHTEQALLYVSLARGLSQEPKQEAMLADYLGGLLQTQGKYEEAEAEHRRALALSEQAEGPQHPHVAATRNNLAMVHYARGNYAEAEAEFRRSLALREAALGPEHPDVTMSRNNLALVLAGRGQYEKAEAELRRVSDLWEQSLGPAHPYVAGSRTNLAVALLSQKRHEEAEAEFRRALALREKALGPEHPHVAMAHTNVAASLAVQEKFEEAEAEQRRALALQEKTMGPEHPDLAMSRTNLAEILMAQGKADEALELAEQAWSRRQQDDIPAEDRGQAAYVLATALVATRSDAHGQRRARELAERAAEAYEEAGSAQAERLAVVQAWLAKHHPSGADTNQ